MIRRQQPALRALAAAISISIGFAIIVFAANLPLTIPEGLLGAPVNIPVGTAIPTTALALPGTGDGTLQASYDPQTWTGDIRHFSADGELLWSAAAMLPAPSARRLFTTAILPNGEPGIADLQDLPLPPTLRGTLADAALSAIRTRPLGAIVHGTPAFAGPPAPTISGLAYFNFLRRYGTRAPSVYAPANDGLLHAIDAASGIERWAYIPPALLDRLTTTRQPPRTLFDASPAIAEAWTGQAWRTILATGYGMGQRGVFALDVTDPQSPSAGAGEVFAFTDADDAAIGYLFTAPAIVKVKVGMAGGLPQYRAFVATSSGINGEGAPALFLLALDKLARADWRHNTNYYRIDLPEAQGPLTAPGLALGADGSLQYAYCADLAGNVWRIDLTGRPPWGHAAARLFVARDATGQRQPITAAPAIAHAQGGGYMIVVGTGKWLEADDAEPARYAEQTLYAVRDTLAHPIDAIGSRSALAARELRPADDGYSVTGAAADPGRSPGWYIDLSNATQSGERLVAPPLLRDGVAIFRTLIPPRGADMQAESRVYAIEVLSGLPPVMAGEQAQTGQRIATPSTFAPLLVASGSGTGPPTAAGGATGWHTWTFVTPGSAPDAGPRVTTTLPAHRLSWREIPNWAERHRAAVQAEHSP